MPLLSIIVIAVARLVTSKEIATTHSKETNMEARLIEAMDRGENKIPLCPQCKKYEMIKTNYQEYFCTKCGCLSAPHWIDGTVTDIHKLTRPAE